MFTACASTDGTTWTKIDSQSFTTGQTVYAGLAGSGSSNSSSSTAVFDNVSITPGGSLPNPAITGLSPASGAPGASITISGSGFGTTQGTGTVQFNGWTANASSWSDTQIVAAVPTGATTGPVSVTSGNITAQGPSFTVALTLQLTDSAGDAPTLAVDLTDERLPGPHLKVVNGVVWVPAFTDFKLHDCTSGPDDPNREALDMNQNAGSPPFFAGNGKFLTRKLWGIANQHPFGHHGLYTTMREAVLAHSGEALQERAAFQQLSEYDRDSIIEFLKSLQILPANTQALVVDETGRPKSD